MPATGITVTPETASVDVGDTTSLTATLAPAGATDTVTWESSDPEVATVSASGVVTGVAAGTATITARARTFTDTATITVTEP
ncbi:Ig-like domain-containing protein [Citrobacter freundii]